MTISDQRSARPAGDRAAAGGVRRAGRDPAGGPVRAGRLVHPGDGAARAVQGPLRLHHHQGKLILNTVYRERH